MYSTPQNVPESSATAACPLGDSETGVAGVPDRPTLDRPSSPSHPSPSQDACEFAAVIVASMRTSAQVATSPRDDAVAATVARIEATSATAVGRRASDGADALTWSANRIGRTHHGPLDTDGHFRIGSVTKTFVATVVLRLVEEGRIQLDGSIAEQLPCLVPGGYEISSARTDLGGSVL
jgi:CubicO group peptidase (beta-lactamase class C family)